MPKRLTLYNIPWSGDPAEDRNLFLGGSDTGTILGINPYKSIYSLWLEKTGQIKPPDISQKIPIRVGHMVEDTVARLYEQETGNRVRESLVSYMCKEYPFLRGHVDRLLINDQTRGLECKTTSSHNHYDYAHGEVPPYYYSQCQFYMMITGKKHWDLATLRDNTEFFVNEIDRDDEYISALLDRLIWFWKLVETKTPPPIDGSVSTTTSLNTKYSKGDKKKTVSLNDINDLLIKREKYAEMEKEYKSLKNEIDNIVREKLGNNEVGRSEDYFATWILGKPRFNPSKARKLLTEEQYEECLDEPTRTLRIKKESRLDQKGKK